MKFENLDKLFELYVQEAVRKNKEKYSSHEALEDDLGMLFNRFENVRIKTLDGKTPKEYAAELAFVRKQQGRKTSCRAFT